MAKSQSKARPSQQPQAPEDQLRERVKRYQVQRFYTRFHMSLILMSAGFAAMLGNWLLLHWGVGKMFLRYPVALTLSYLTFLAGVWLWIQYVEFRRGSAEAGDPSVGRRSKAKGGSSALDLLPNGGGSIRGGGGGGSSIELPNVLRGGGGSFDGGGAAGGWDEVLPAQALASTASSNSSAGGDSFGETVKGFGKNLGDFGDLDGDAIGLIIMALLLAASVLLLSGYIVWFAPDILSEAIFGATLAGSLARTANRQDNEGWVMGVFKKTWWPFAIVFAVAMAFAIYAEIHYPASKTLGEALAAAAAS